MSGSLKHELRTPLNHIIGYCELLIEEAADRGTEAMVADVQRIHAAGKRLLVVVNDLFDRDKGAALRANRSLVHHELRTPLNQILGYAEMLLEENEGSGRAEVLADLTRIDAAARELLRLVVEHLLGEDEAATLLPVASNRGATTFVRRSDVAALRSGLTGSLLVVDDDPGNRDMLARRLTRLGHQITLAENGREALEILRRTPFDLMLLDIQMPELNGYQVLEVMKADPALRDVPVIVLSASDETERVAHCIQMGAEDYLPKPFEPVLLQARLGACLEKKQLRDREQIHLRQIEEEQQKSERLLLNVLPPPIAERLKRGEQGIADSFAEVTILFADLVGFSSMAAGVAPAQLVERLNEIFSAFDNAVAALGLEKIKTIGDAYMAVGGLPVPRNDHAEAVAELALRMQDEIQSFSGRTGTSTQIRVGINTGPVVAGIIGRRKFSYDLWGDAVNLASRMESHSLPGRIQVAASAHARLEGRYHFEPRGPIEIKGIGLMPTFFLLGRRL
jgi:class 3 adenylate cyclase/CheY-like chemotaxis protein